MQNFEKCQTPNNQDNGWVIHEADSENNIETQYSGEILNLKKLEFHRLERKFLVQTLTVTTCILFLGVIGWGTITNNWEPFERTSNKIDLILGYLLCYYFKGI